MDRATGRSELNHNLLRSFDSFCSALSLIFGDWMYCPGTPKDRVSEVYLLPIFVQRIKAKEEEDDDSRAV